ncbi:50S ribosomal protein L3 [Buchnera aphidicola]|uniref:50S ribosomal protein L3 n=1 Tax=Buchnera aphidicola TaxID=9 RepID=UPI0031B89418
MVGLIGKKIGMTRFFMDSGRSIGVTVIFFQNHYITQMKNISNDGYNAIQLTTGFKKKKKIKKTEIGHFLKSGVKVGNGLWEFRYIKNDNYFLGKKIDINIFKKIKSVNVTGFSKGKGFSGTVKRWNFSMQDATHGNSLSHRAPGSIGQNQTPGRVFKGKKMAGQLGNKRITIKNLNIIKIDFLRNLLLVKGSVPGCKGSFVIVKPVINILGVI